MHLQVINKTLSLMISMFAPFIMKVMAYCGVSIKEQDVVAVAANAEQVTEQKKS
jgi:hypothetical protein